MMIAIQVVDKLLNASSTLTGRICLYQVRKVSGHVYCVREIHFASVSTTFLLDFGTVRAVWYFTFSILLSFYE